MSTIHRRPSTAHNRFFLLNRPQAPDDHTRMTFQPVFALAAKSGELAASEANSSNDQQVQRRHRRAGKINIKKMIGDRQMNWKKNEWMNGRTEKLWGCEHVIYYFEYFVWRVEKWIVDNLRAWMCSCVGVRARFLLSHPRSWTLLFSADVREWSGLGWTERRTECEERPAHCSLASCHQLHSLPASAGSGEPGERGARHPRKQRPRTLQLNDPSPPTSDVEARGFCSATEEDKQRHPTSLWTSCKCSDWRYCWGKVSNQWHFRPVS